MILLNIYKVIVALWAIGTLFEILDSVAPKRRG